MSDPDSRLLQPMRAIWATMDALAGDYSEVPFRGIMEQPRDQHLRERWDKRFIP